MIIMPTNKYLNENVRGKYARDDLLHNIKPGLTHSLESSKKYIYMLFAGWEVSMVKNCDRGLENTARGRRPMAAFSRPRF